ncbi:MAG: helix-turn-helix transcriptional regulator [Bacteroidota bacterium]
MQILSQSQYFGTRRHEMLHRGISLSEYDYYEPGTPWHYHENPYFMYVLAGNMVDVAKSGSSLLPPGSLMFLNWEETHRTDKRSRRGRGMHLQIERQWLREQEIDDGLWEGSQVLQHPDFHLLLGKIHLELRRADDFSRLSVELLTMQLCDLLNDKFVAESAHRPPWIEDLRELLHAEGERLSLTELSQELGVHPVHISRSVPDFLGSTLGEYLRKQRLSKALPELLDHQKSLAQIACASGFADQSHFTRVFKAYFGVTPARFRRGERAR